MIIPILISLTIFLQNTDINMTKENIYSININMLDGSELNWADFKGKKVLIVNVASECGYTPQYTQLQELADMYSDNLVVLGIPCNDFGGQEPGNADEIKTFCSTKYHISFPMTEKVGIVKDTHPLYQWLTQAALNGKSDFEVKWNFTKFLINADGSLENSYPSSITPLDDAIINWVKG